MNKLAPMKPIFSCAVALFLGIPAFAQSADGLFPVREHSFAPINPCSKSYHPFALKYDALAFNSSTAAIPFMRQTPQHVCNYKVSVVVRPTKTHYITSDFSVPATQAMKWWQAAAYIGIGLSRYFVSGDFNSNYTLDN